MSMYISGPRLAARATLGYATILGFFREAAVQRHEPEELLLGPLPSSPQDASALSCPL